MESPKDPATPTGTIKYVKRTKIYSNLNSSDEGGGEDCGSNNEYVPSPVFQPPKFTREETEGQDRSGLSSSSGSGSDEDKEREKLKNDAVKLEPLFQRSRFARVRTRFPVPVILWNNKNVSYLITYVYPPYFFIFIITCVFVYLYYLFPILFVFTNIRYADHQHSHRS